MLRTVLANIRDVFFDTRCLACDGKAGWLDSYCSETCEYQHTRVPELAEL